jgi:beta-glucosidase
MAGKPVIIIINTTNPLVLGEIEPSASSILISFGLQDQALLDIISGKAEPQALLPMQMPLDMKSVETQAEDVPFDMTAYKDSEGHSYDFAFGMNWKGVISDERVAKFK